MIALVNSRLNNTSEDLDESSLEMKPQPGQVFAMGETGVSPDQRSSRPVTNTNNFNPSHNTTGFVATDSLGQLVHVNPPETMLQ